MIEAAAEHRTALEVNGHLDRMDMSADHAHLAAPRGLILLANSDAHRPDEMPNVANAAGILQKARAVRAGAQHLACRCREAMAGPSLRPRSRA